AEGVKSRTIKRPAPFHQAYLLVERRVPPAAPSEPLARLASVVDGEVEAAAGADRQEQVAVHGEDVGGLGGVLEDGVEGEAREVEAVGGGGEPARDAVAGLAGVEEAEDLPAGRGLRQPDLGRVDGGGVPAGGVGAAGALAPHARCKDLAERLDAALVV